VSPWLSPDVVVATNASSVSGPATLIGTSYPFSGSMGSNRQVGLVGSNPSGSFALGHAVTDRRAASPFSTRFTPLQLSAAPAYNATGYPPTSSGTMTVTEIDGPLGPQARLPAYRLSTTKSPGPESKDGLNIGIPFVGTNAVDDLWIVGMWMRAPNSTVYLDGPSMVLGSNPPYVTLDLSENSYYIREPSFDQAWQWVTFATRITAVSDNPALMMLSAWVYADYPLDIYQPTVYRLPAGTYDASDAMEWAQRIVPVPAGATPGNAVLLPGQNLEFGTLDVQLQVIERR